ncbi:4Fe-4S binding protein [Achromobacter sp. NPDC058515]|uniref:4Fe-4S binding protein n=1 Tax=Achromobacter sp. NPDC058515 TaxID=3346533 RepID=UPI00365B267A
MFIGHAAQAQRLPEFLASTPIDAVFPGADRVGPAEGKPMVARAYSGDRQLGLVYLTSDVVNTRGYSSKPIDVLVGLSDSGRIVGAKLVEHHEPIVLIGIPQSKVDHFIQGYVGLNFVESPPRHGAPPPVDIVSGATVTLMVIGDTITRSAIAVARAHGIDKAGASRQAAPAAAARVLDEGQAETQSWQALLDSGAVRNLRLSPEDVNQAFLQSGRKDAAEHRESGQDDTFIDLYVALVSAPSIGRSLLGDTGWQRLKERLKPGQQAVLVAGNGAYSFKGSGYVRGGIFDRIEVVQDESSFRFRDRNHQRLADVSAAGAPALREVALFVVPEDAALDPVKPWRLQLMVQRVLSVSDKAFVTFDLPYELPRAYTRAVEPAAPAPQAPAAAPAADAADAAPALWKQIWQGKAGQIAILTAALTVLVGIFFFQDQLAARPLLHDRLRLAFLAFALFWIGWYGQAQLSIVNVLTFFSALRTDFRWEYFLMDPLVFILWCATAISMVFWNRGAFCGWLCPFGALQELSNRVAKRLGVRQLKIRHGVNQRLSTLKYVIFLLLFGFSLYDLAVAEQLAEVEPFKTAIILHFMRYWPFVAFAVALLVAGLFVERFFCRYLCPLGAALAIPARLRIFNWLRRYRDCGNPCQRCNLECPVQAIDPTGEINPNECIQCLHCQMLYHHQQKCPHLIQKKAKRERRAAPAAEPAVQEVVMRRAPNMSAPASRPPAES